MADMRGYSCSFTALPDISVLFQLLCSANKFLFLTKWEKAWWVERDMQVGLHFGRM
jgi:hypothetical protein